MFRTLVSLSAKKGQKHSYFIFSVAINGNKKTIRLLWILIKVTKQDYYSKVTHVEAHRKFDVIAQLVLIYLQQELEGIEKTGRLNVWCIFQVEQHSEHPLFCLLYKPNQGQVLIMYL